MNNEESLKRTLENRGKKYGNFKEMCEAQAALKRAMRFHVTRFENLAPYQQEALDMFAVKIGRILTGDPDYDDNWRDIAGYALKVLDSLPQRGD